MTKDDDASAISAERWIAILRYRGMDAEALLVAQRRNLKALMQASEVVAKGLDEATGRHAGLMRQSLGRLRAAMPEVGAPQGNLEDLARQQLDYSRQTVETALTHFQELGDLVWRCNREAYERINRSLLDSLQSFLQARPEGTAEPAMPAAPAKPAKSLKPAKSTAKVRRAKTPKAAPPAKGAKGTRPAKPSPRTKSQARAPHAKPPKRAD